MLTKPCVLNCYVYPVLTHESETWTLTSKTQRNLESCEMRFLRMMLKIKWTDKITNDEVLRWVSMRRTLLLKICTQQLTFLGHVIGKRGLKDLAMMGKAEGKRGRGRRWVVWLSSMRELLEERIFISVEQSFCGRLETGVCGGTWLSPFTEDMASRERGRLG